MMKKMRPIMRKLKKEAINPIEECKDESTGGEVGVGQFIRLSIWRYVLQRR